MQTKIKQVMILFSSVLLLLTAATLSGAENSTFVIRDAKVYTLGAAGTLERASIVIVDGKIADVAERVRVPRGAQVIRGRGLEVYPGMINAMGTIGLSEVGAVEVTVDTNEMGNYKPQLLAFHAINWTSEHFPVARVNGITTAVSAPGGGVISGQAALVHLDGWTSEEMAVMKSAGMMVNFPSLGGGRGRRGGPGRTQAFSARQRQHEASVKEFSEWLEKARHYAKAMEANPSTERDRELEALVPVVQGQMLVFLRADSARDIRNAIEFGKKEKLRFVIVGGREAVEVADLLKKEDVPVILGSVYSLPSRRDAPYDAAYTVPTRLAEAGVKFALTSPSPANVRNLPYEAGMSVAYGLSRDEALKAITINPAEILGVADRIGTIEKGKVADLVVTDGDMLEIRTQVRNVFISGKNVPLESKHTKLYQKYMNRP
jgi:imidazolonepropionase-like amidohydrolase